jgi:hypothetical protein
MKAYDSGVRGSQKYEWFDRIGYTVDCAALRREFPDVVVGEGAGLEHASPRRIGRPRIRQATNEVIPVSQIPTHTVEDALAASRPLLQKVIQSSSMGRPLNFHQPL